VTYDRAKDEATLVLCQICDGDAHYENIATKPRLHWLFSAEFAQMHGDLFAFNYKQTGGKDTQNFSKFTRISANNWKEENIPAETHQEYHYPLLFTDNDGIYILDGVVFQRDVCNDEIVHFNPTMNDWQKITVAANEDLHFHDTSEIISIHRGISQPKIYGILRNDSGKELFSFDQEDAHSPQNRILKSIRINIPDKFAPLHIWRICNIGNLLFGICDYGGLDFGMDLFLARIDPVSHSLRKLRTLNHLKRVFNGRVSMCDWCGKVCIVYYNYSIFSRFIKIETYNPKNGLPNSVIQLPAEFFQPLFIFTNSAKGVEASPNSTGGVEASPNSAEGVEASPN
jgi:hypothetical protein